VATVRDPRQRGLPSLNEAREQRKRALVAGKARIYGGSPLFWLWVFLVLAAFTVIYWKFAEGKLESQKSAIMAKQRAVMQTLGVKIIPFRDRLEKWVLELAHSEPSLVASGDIDAEALATTPSVYLRARLKNAESVASLRAAAQKSLRDGFTSCLFVRKEATDGTPCRTPADCSGGLVCNDFSVCGRPSQPFNLRLAYRALRILSTEWTDELHRASTDLKARAFELDLDAVTRTDVPVAIELLSRARYFALVLDEEPAEGLPPALPRDVPGEKEEGEDERLARVSHTARIGIWDIQSEKLVVRLRAEASGQFVPMGSGRLVDPRTRAAEQRQVNSCALALEVQEALSKAGQKAPPGSP